MIRTWLRHCLIEVGDFAKAVGEASLLILPVVLWIAIVVLVAIWRAGK